MSHFLESTTPGMHYAVTYVKWKGEDGRVVACEGRLIKDAEGVVTGFEQQDGLSRSHRVQLTGRATRKRKAEAHVVMLANLEDMGLVLKRQSLPLPF